MKTNDFLSLLQTHKDKQLLFEYAPGKYVANNYHITEIKHITVDAVDCGTGTDFWKETLIQLWENPGEEEKRVAMSAFKALGILNKVHQIKPFVHEAELKFEYGNANFHTAQLFVNDVLWNNDHLIIKLAAEKTTCKAQEACGVGIESTENTVESGCAPGSGCC